MSIEEIEFKDWLNSIEFVDEKGNIVTPELTEDDSPDPENDRG